MAWRFFALLITLWGQHKAAAYPTPVDFFGKILRWEISQEHSTIYYDISSDESIDVEEFIPVVNEAADLWSDVPLSALHLAPSDTENPASITITLRRTIADSSTSAGYAVFDKYQSEKPLHCTANILIEEGLTLPTAKTILHEMGHCLGLGHSLIPEAIMSYSLDKNDFALDTDDKGAIARLYPENNQNPKLPPGCSISNSRYTSLPATWLLLIPLIIFLL